MYYAMLVLGRKGSSTCETRYFVGYNRRMMSVVLTSLAKEACVNAGVRPLETGIWSVHDHLGVALEAHTYCSQSSNRWRTVGRSSLPYYNLNATAHTMMLRHCDTIGDDGIITENNKE